MCNLSAGDVTSLRCVLADYLEYGNHDLVEGYFSQKSPVNARIQ